MTHGANPDAYPRYLVLLPRLRRGDFARWAACRRGDGRALFAAEKRQWLSHSRHRVLSAAGRNHARSTRLCRLLRKTAGQVRADIDVGALQFSTLARPLARGDTG